MIVCSTGIGTSLLLKSKINAKFKDKIEILDVCAMYQIKTYPEDEYDLIISTIPLEAKKDSIVVTPLLNEDDIEQINRYLKYGNDQFKPIKNLFVSELFFPDIDLDNREDIIEFMSDQLLEKGYIDQECKESYKKRENMATTEIGNLVSVPHSMDGKIYKSAICVGILNKPIQWEYGMVQIVLMIAVRKEDIHKENEFFLHVYQKFDPLYKAKKSISMKNIEYIRQQFTGGIYMKKILVACGAGVCTSTVALQKLKTAMEQRGLSNQVSYGQCAVADLGMNAKNYDLVITTSKVTADYGVPVVFGLNFITGIGIEPLVDDIVKKLGL